MASIHVSCIHLPTYTHTHMHSNSRSFKRGWGDEFLCGSVRTTYSQAWPSTVISEANRKTPGLIRLNSTPDVTLATTCTVHITHIQNTFRLSCKCYAYTGLPSLRCHFYRYTHMHIYMYRHIFQNQKIKIRIPKHLCP